MNDSLGFVASPARRSPTSVLVVEDDTLVARGITKLLAPIAPVRVATTESEACTLLREQATFHLVLIDLTLGNDPSAGLRVLDVASTALPHVKRALLTGSRDERVMWQAAQRGAIFLPKPFEPDALLEIAEPPPPPTTLHQYVADCCRGWKVRGKQARIVTLAVDGTSRANIAGALGVKTSTAATYVRRLLARTGFTSLGQLGHSVLRAFAEKMMTVRPPAQ
jgi:DNA-binding NarL/FixJ family response regulator